MNGQPICFMLVAAEASGDTLGAALMRTLRARYGQTVRFVGIGGAAMREEGLSSAIDIAGLSILGLFDGLKAIGRVHEAVALAGDIAQRERPAAIILIDSWGLTIRIAQRIRQIDPSLPLIKYVGPQVWAHRSGRAKKIAAAFDQLLSTNTLDLPYYEGLGLPVTFVGNPALQTDFRGASAERFRSSIGASQEEPVLLVLPGSRPSEITRLAAPFGDAVSILRARIPQLRVLVIVAGPVSGLVRSAVEAWGVELIEGDAPKRDAMLGATAALAASGTVSTELALAGCPMVIGYRLGALSYFVVSRMTSLRYVTLFNIAADWAVAPELIQRRCTGPELADALTPLLENPDLRRQQSASQTAALNLMGPRDIDPAEVAARAIAELIASRRART